MVTLNLTEKEADVVYDHLQGLADSNGQEMAGYEEVERVVAKLRKAGD